MFRAATAGIDTSPIVMQILGGGAAEDGEEGADDNHAQAQAQAQAQAEAEARAAEEQAMHAEKAKNDKKRRAEEKRRKQQQQEEEE